MAEKKKPGKKSKALVPQRMGKPVGKELFDVDPKEANFVLTRVDVLVKEVQSAQIELTGLLYKVAQGEFYKKLGFDRFEEYIEKHLGWKERKGRFFLAIHKNLVLAGAKPTDLQKIGWTKAGIIAALPPGEREEKKLLTWLERAAALASLDLQAEVNKAKNNHLGEKRHEENATKKETFGFHDEQHDNVKMALEVAEKVSGSDVKSNNLDLMATEFLAQRAEEAGVKLKRHLDNLERVFDCKIVAISDKDEKILYGAKVAKQYGLT